MGIVRESHSQPASFSHDMESVHMDIHTIHRVVHKVIIGVQT
jgi:hypothetical protein